MPALHISPVSQSNFTSLQEPPFPRIDLLPPSPRPPPPTAPLLRRERGVSSDPDLLYEVPAELAALQKKFNGGTFDCEFQLDTGAGYERNGDGKDGTHICGDSATPTYTYWVSNMDVDCDGGHKSDTVCTLDQSWQSATRFQDEAGESIDAIAVPYVVLNYEDNMIDLDKIGIQPLSVVAVVCDGKLVYGVWADSNSLRMMGESSIKLSQICFGVVPEEEIGYSPADVLYVAFVGDKASTVPAGSGSDAVSLKEIGDALIQKHFGSTGGANDTVSVDVGKNTSATGGNTVTTSKLKTATETGGAATTSPVATSPVVAVAESQPTPTSNFATATSFLNGDPTKTYIMIGICALLVLLGVCIIGYTAFRKRTKKKHHSKEGDSADDDDGQESGSTSGSQSDSEDDKRKLVHSRHQR